MLSAADKRWTIIAAGSELITSVIGQIVSAPGVRGWYRTIAKPVFTPPNWVFPVAWTILFTMMGTAFWMVLRRPSETPFRRTAIALFVVQLVFNSAWSAAFFGAKSPFLGLIVIVPFWGILLATGIVFRKVHRLASMLLVPYLAWVAFAALLNFTIWRMN